MVNQSKVNDPRFWGLWEKSGAVEDIYTPSRREEIHIYRLQQRSGNLTRHEIRELEIFEFYKGPQSVDEQVRRYYLKLKSIRPDKAIKMLAETQLILSDGINSVENIETLCRTVYKYYLGFLIHFNGESYSVHDNIFDKCSNLYPISSKNTHSF